MVTKKAKITKLIFVNILAMTHVLFSLCSMPMFIHTWWHEAIRMKRLPVGGRYEFSDKS